MTPAQLQIARPVRSVQLLSGLDQLLYEQTRQHLGTTDQTFISSFLNRPVGPAFTIQGCKIRWKQVGENDCLIHFFGHATGSEIRLSEAEPLTAETFRRLFQRESRPRSQQLFVLSFLNGCASVSGEDADNFLVATADPGFCGFIGAEAEVPDRFALLFGQELLFCLMVLGLSVRKAMSYLRCKHNPMALLYGCYANPDFAIDKDPYHASLPPTFDLCNFHPQPDQTP
jgi:hypothetical protein